MLGATQPITIEHWLVGENRDAYGRRTASYSANLTVKGNLFERASRELVDGQWTTVATWQALLPSFVTVTSHDILIDEEGHRYRIQSVVARRGPSGETHHISCLCVRTDD